MSGRRFLIAILLSFIVVLIMMRPIVRSGNKNERVDPSVFMSLPYIAGAPVSAPDEKDGVLINKKDKTCDGLNFFNSRRMNMAVLMDMEGNIVHRWEHPGSKNWHHVELTPAGDIYAIEKDSHLVKLDKDSRVIWQYNGRCHHDVSVDTDGKVYVLTRKSELKPLYNNDKPVDVDYITVLSPGGEKLYELPLLSIMEGSAYSYYLDKTKTVDSKYIEDIIHANSIEVLDGSLASKSPRLYKKGNILFSCRNIDFIGIYDPEADKVIWGWGRGEISMQHQPTLLPNGKILVFDNGQTSMRSRAIEVNPLSSSAGWRYGDEPSEHIYTNIRGGAQRLPNGNTLITLSDSGIAIEVTRAKEVVWKFINPKYFKINGNIERDAIYRMTRFAPDKLTFLRNNLSAAK